jgi:hypothetical protein
VDVDIGCCVRAYQLVARLIVEQVQHTFGRPWHDDICGDSQLVRTETNCGDVDSLDAPSIRRIASDPGSGPVLLESSGMSGETASARMVSLDP